MGYRQWSHTSNVGRPSSPSGSYSPEGTRLASCGGDGAVLLWDLAAGKRLQTLRQDRPYERLNISGIRGLTEAQKEDLHTLGAIEEPEQT